MDSLLESTAQVLIAQMRLIPQRVLCVISPEDSAVNRAAGCLVSQPEKKVVCFCYVWK